MNGLLELLKLDQEWIPRNDGSALYIRPFYFATDEIIKLRSSESYRFIIMTSPVGPYYSEPVSLWVTEEIVRAVQGGTGESKAAGNYAASLLGAKIAADKGCHNVLWLDGKEKKYIDECGTMNIVFIIDGKAVTPELNGSILPGITRDTALTILRDLMGVEVQERPVSFDEIKEAAANGTLQECFGTGTAATIANVVNISYEGGSIDIPNPDSWKISPELLKRFNDIKLGRSEDPYGWVVNI